jgi:hypothetical protein
MQWVGNFLNFLAKFYWAIFILAGIVLFAPADFARSTGIATIREQNPISLWILFLFLGAWLLRDTIFFIGKTVTQRPVAKK